MSSNYYVKAQSPDGCTTTLVGIHMDNVFTRCPDCGTEYQIALDEILEPGFDYDGTAFFCDECARKRRLRQEAPHQTLRDEEDKGVVEMTTPDELGIVPGQQPTYGQMRTTLAYYVEERGVELNRVFRELGDYTKLSQVPAERYWELLYLCEVVAG